MTQGRHDPGPARIVRWMWLVVMTGLLMVAGSPERLGPSPAAAAPQGVVTDVRVAEYDAVTTRVVLDVSRQVEYRVFTLADPDRVVVDMSEVGWRLPSRPLPRDVGLMRHLRYGLFKPGTTRMVMETRGPTRVKQSFILAPNQTQGPRLVLDLVEGPSEVTPPPTAVPADTVTVGARAPRTETARAAPVALAPTSVSAPRSSPSPLQAPRRAKASASEAAKVTPVRFLPPPPKPHRERSRRMVVLDPGHGGIDPGTVGAMGTYEKHITLTTARAIRDALEKTGQFAVFLTRERDVFIPLRDRVAFAREKGAELFISIHADAIKNSSIRGASVYTLSERASDAESEALADKENKADLIAGIDLTGESPEVTNILIDLAQRESMNESARFATRMVQELRRETNMLRRTHRFAGFAVLKAPDIPSVLLELGFLSNGQDEANLRDADYRAKVAQGVARAVDAHFTRIEEAARR